MKIGDPRREIYIEPIELPEPLRESPAIKPEEVPTEEPVNEPIRQK